ncbi:3-hydroxyacyl-CoA dehydrogenase/enoyl-CoA hydratase family protein [Candidatus Tisiphia endosymbiont of Beris chalybata]|uniref:3-hydroxyacyl-CoA dehydrogenase/enoyl-CoA hydratase family protein n=1 Tax=Candidatus Tisiphia endosymbiont of Beris chalybata TaxID=3066262 RepID=UPI00312C91DE
MAQDKIDSLHIQKVCVIGSGVMGSAIAALIANSSCHVVLLDIASNNPNDRNAVVKKAIDNIQKQRPPSLSHPSKLAFIKIGNLEDDLQLITECDLVIEVIIEQIDIKYKLYNKIIPYLKNDTILASNTSTLPLKQLKEKMPDSVKSRFVITHFFNPPRYMELLELITDQTVDPVAIDKITSFLTVNLGKTIVKSNDTPGFIANRIGCYLLELVVRTAIKANLNPVIIDKIFTNLLKLPNTGIFGLYDLIGHDVMKLISTSLVNSLPMNDQYRKIYIPTPVLEKMIAKNLIGRKGLGGFYRLSVINKVKTKEVINFLDLSYTPIDFLPKSKREEELLEETKPAASARADMREEQRQVSTTRLADRYELQETSILLSDDFAARRDGAKPIDNRRAMSNDACNFISEEYINELLDSDSIYGQFFKSILVEFYLYLTSLIPEVTDNIYDIDKAMRLGYSWKLGPFELLYNIKDGFEWLKKEATIRNLPLPKYIANNHYQTIDRSKFQVARINLQESQILLKNDGAQAFLYQDRLVFSMSTKMNCLNEDVFILLLEAIDLAEQREKDLYIVPLTDNFSAGADLKLVAHYIKTNNFAKLDGLLELGQQAMMRLKYSRINIISCAVGFALGGGCEILLHSDFILANQELNAGLVEVSRGLVPGFGGIKEMFYRAKGNEDRLIKNITNILTANKTSSADYFILDYGITSAQINMNKQLIFSEALQLNLPNKVVKVDKKITLPQIILSEKLDVSQYDELQIWLLDRFQEIIAMQEIDEQGILDQERKIFLELAQNPKKDLGF